MEPRNWEDEALELGHRATGYVAMVDLANASFADVRSTLRVFSYQQYGSDQQYEDGAR